MATTLSSLQTKLNNLADETVDATKATSWINDAYKDVASRSDWSWLQSSSNFDTEVGEYSYALAADLMELFQVRTQAKRLTPQSRQWLFENAPAYPEYTNEPSVPMGQPSTFVEFGGNLWLHPIPEDVQTVYYLYRKTPAELTGPTDEAIIPDEHREVLVLGAYVKWLLSDEADKYMIDQAKRDYEEKIGSMIMLDQTKRNISQTIPYERR